VGVGRGLGCQGGPRRLGLRTVRAGPPRQGCCASRRDGLRPPLTLEPLPALGQALSGGPGGCDWGARWVCAMGVRAARVLARINFAGADDLK